MLDRYSRNYNMLDNNDMELLSKAKVFVVGCGGLGGYVVEELARLGVGNIKAIDGDVFDETNLNRQLLSSEKNLGVSKVEEAEKRVNLINSTVKFTGYKERLNVDNIKSILNDIDIVVDAVDNVETKLLLERECSERGIILVHGAIGGWYGQVSTIYPNDGVLQKIYNKVNHGIEKTLGNPSFTPAVIASIQVSEVLKLITNKGDVLRNQILFIDLKEHEYNVLKINN